MEKNSLQYPYFRHASRSRLELGECLQTGCLQGGKEEFEHSGEPYSLNSLWGGGERAGRCSESVCRVVECLGKVFCSSFYIPIVAIQDHHHNVNCRVPEVWSV